MTLSFAAWAQEDPEKESVTEDDLEKHAQSGSPREKGKKRKSLRVKRKKADAQAAAPAEEKEQKNQLPCR